MADLLNGSYLLIYFLLLNTYAFSFFLSLNFNFQSFPKCVVLAIFGCLVAKLYATLCDPMNCSPPASSDHGISQARILEWVAISLSRESSWPRDWTHVPCFGRKVLHHWTTWEALFWPYVVLFPGAILNLWMLIFISFSLFYHVIFSLISWKIILTFFFLLSSIFCIIFKSSDFLFLFAGLVLWPSW